MRMLVAGLLVSAAGAVGGCGRGASDQHEKVIADIVAATDEYADILETIVDEPSIRTAEPRLAAVLERLDEIKLRMSKLPEPGKTEDERLARRWAAKMIAARERCDRQMERILKDPAIAAAAKEAVGKMKTGALPGPPSPSESPGRVGPPAPGPVEPPAPGKPGS